jgi:hypothetical protein
MPSRLTILVLLSVGHIYSPTCRCASCGFLLRNDGEVALRLFFLRDRERCGAPSGVSLISCQRMECGASHKRSREMDEH